MTAKATPRPILWTLLGLAILIGFAGCFLFLGEPEPDPTPNPQPGPQAFEVALTDATLSYGTDPAVGTTVNSGDTVMWYSAGDNSTLEFTITNTGGPQITMTQATAVIIEDTDGSDESGNFSIPVQPSSPIDPGGSVPFEVALTYANNISFTVTVRLRVDDDDDDFVLTVTGWGQY